MHRRNRHGGHMKLFSRSLAFIVGMFLSLSVLASAVIESVAGDVKAGPSAAAAKTVSQGQRIQAGTTVATGARSAVILRFDDGQAVALNENAEFRVAEYSFAKE